MEKQVFTAVHELGHIWNVDEFVAADLGMQKPLDLSEKIINRFAAGLLMPAKSFSASAHMKLHEFAN